MMNGSGLQDTKGQADGQNDEGLFARRRRRSTCNNDILICMSTIEAGVRDIIP